MKNQLSLRNNNENSPLLSWLLGGTSNWFGGINMPTVQDKGDEVEVKFPVPGLSKDNIELDFQDGNLEVFAKQEDENEFTQLCYREYLGSTIRPEDTVAELKDGILTVRSKKTEPKKIEIKVT